ncbi:MAG: nucleotidyltransferase family protein [Gordonia sp. (in: high G+C Gram-positive bacteria)]
MRVMMLAAGRGERMGDLTADVPKPLLRAGRHTLIDHQLNRLAAGGFREIVVNLAYRGDQIVDHLGDGSRLGVTIRYSHEDDRALGTGGGIKNALGLLGPQPFLLTNADVYTDFPYGDLRRQRLAADDLAHLVLVPNPPQHPGGDFGLIGDRVVTDSRDRLTYSGIAVLRPALCASVAETSFSFAPRLIAAIDDARVSGQCHHGEWRDIGTPDRLARLDAELTDRDR